MYIQVTENICSQFTVNTVSPSVRGWNSGSLIFHETLSFAPFHFNLRKQRILPSLSLSLPRAVLCSRGPSSIQSFPRAEGVGLNKAL